MERERLVRVGAIGDTHCTRNSTGRLRPLFEEMAEHCDIIALCGDLTDFGLVEEAKVLVQELQGAKDTPLVAVLGNHDFESGHEADVRSILCDAGVHVLDGDACVINGVGFGGVKGFAGGFEGRSLEAWGEQMIKNFVHEAVNEALKLESALSRLRAERKIALMHYSPIRATVEGEAPEIIAFLGSRRLEEPLIRFPVDYVFHGHAHSGQPEGATRNGIPVYNVALPMLRRHQIKPTFRVVNLVLNAQDQDELRHEPSMRSSADDGLSLH